MMLLGHGSDGEPQVYAHPQLGQHLHPHAVSLCRRLGTLSSLRTWPPDIADMAGTRSRVVTMSLSTVPPVDCKRAAAAARCRGPTEQLALARSDRVELHVCSF